MLNSFSFVIYTGTGGLSGSTLTDPIINGRAKADSSWNRHSIVLIPIMMGRYLKFKSKRIFSALSHRLCIVEVYSKGTYMYVNQTF